MQGYPSWPKGQDLSKKIIILRYPVDAGPTRVRIPSPAFTNKYSVIKNDQKNRTDKSKNKRDSH